MGARNFIQSSLRPSSRRRRSRLSLQNPTRNDSAKKTIPIYFWLFVLGLLLLIRAWVLPHRPRGFPGVPASSLRLLPRDNQTNHDRVDKNHADPQKPSPTPRPQVFPAGYFGVGAKFFFYTSEYGQFNNQVVSLINALIMSRHADAVLVLPFAKLGKESTWDLTTAGLEDQKDVHRELVGDYFNYTRLLASEHVVRPVDFFVSTDARELFLRDNITVNYRSGNAYRKLFGRAAIEIAHRKRLRVKILSPPHEKTPIENQYCNFDPDRELSRVAERGRNGRFTFLPIIFRRHNLNCTMEEKDWISVRRGLVPRDEFLRAVDGFISSLARPLLTVHLRVFLNGDLENFTAQSFVDMLFREYGIQLMRAKTLFLAYSPSSGVSREVFSLLKARFHGKVVDGSNISSFFRKGEEGFASLAFSNVMLDMWVCVKSDIFIGRLGSSLSWNTVFWRMALRKEYGFSLSQVEPPLWYSLSNFSTNMAESRNEGPLYGTNSLHY